MRLVVSPIFVLSGVVRRNFSSCFEHKFLVPRPIACTRGTLGPLFGRISADRLAVPCSSASPMQISPSLRELPLLQSVFRVNFCHLCHFSDPPSIFSVCCAEVVTYIDVCLFFHGVVSRSLPRVKKCKTNPSRIFLKSLSGPQARFFGARQNTQVFLEVPLHRIFALYSVFSLWMLPRPEVQFTAGLSSFRSRFTPQN